MAHSTTMLDQLHPLSPNTMNTSPFSSSSSFDVADFFNLDMLTNSSIDHINNTTSNNNNINNNNTNNNTNAASDSGAASSSSRSSSRSPSGSFAHLPETPPQPDMASSFDFHSSLGLGGVTGGANPYGIDEDALFGGFGASVDYFKPGTDPLAGLSHSPFDLFASLTAPSSTVNGAGVGGGVGVGTSGGNGGSVSSTTATIVDPSSSSSINHSLLSTTTNPSSSSSNSSSTASTSLSPSSTMINSYSYAIDPQLVGSPSSSSSKASPNSGEETEEERSVDDKNDEDELQRQQQTLTIAPVKVGGKGKARRGTVQSGGISKKTSPGPQSIFGTLSAVEKTAVSSASSSSSMASAPSSVGAKMTKPTTAAVRSKDDKDDDGDDWRPSPEEYQKMSSKEKRQLRNKISARNFRVRRKEYIHTLEGDIADRDRLIDAIRNELGSTKSENYALRQEVAALKKAILEGRASPMLPPPAPLSPLSPLQTFASIQPPSTPPTASSSSGSSSSSSSSTIIKPNTHKDLPTSPRLAASGSASAFWGGQTGFGGLGGGITPVHTAIIPETNFGTPKLGENINPNLNHAPQTNVVMSHILAQLSGMDSANSNTMPYGSSGAGAGAGAAGFGGFDSFVDVNPFTLKTLDAYRMQLWSRIALQSQQQRGRYPSPPSTSSSPHSSPSSSPNPGMSGLSGLASGLRPQYFASVNPSNPTASRPFTGLFGGKGGYLLTPPTSPSPSPSSSPRVVVGEKGEKGEKNERERIQREKERVALQVQQMNSQQQQQQLSGNNANSQGAMLAAIASHTILQKMGQAFWDAFSGTHEKPGKQMQQQQFGAGAGTGTTVRSWDADKVRRVLEGKAVLRVVDVEPSGGVGAAAAMGSVASTTDALEESMRAMSIGGSGSSGAGPGLMTMGGEKEDGKDDKKGGFFGRMRCAGGCQAK